MQKDGTSNEKRRVDRDDGERTREDHFRYDIIANNLNHSRENKQNMTKEGVSRLQEDESKNKSQRNETALKRFKRKFMRKSSKATAENQKDEKTFSQEHEIVGRSWTNSQFDSEDVLDDHVYEVPFSNIRVDEDKEGKPSTKFCNAVDSEPKRTSAGSSENNESLKDDRPRENGAVGYLNKQDRSGLFGNERHGSREERWQQNKSMSLPVTRSKPSLQPSSPGLQPQRKLSLETSSGESSNEEAVEPLPSIQDDKGLLMRSRSLPVPSKFNFNYQFLNGLNDLCKCGWYWGPLTSKEAEVKLHGKPDGTFLVRDSNDNRYLLSLSFRSEGRTLHTRIEFCKGKFSFYAAPFISSGCHESIVELIEDCVKTSKEKVFCYSKGRGHNGASFPVRLMKPLSRFEHVCTLQHLCRFVIRQHFTLENIVEMPLPGIVKRYLGKNHFDAK